MLPWLVWCPLQTWLVNHGVLSLWARKGAQNPSINIILGSHYWSIAADIQCHYLLATPAIPPPDEHLHRNGCSEKIVNSAGCVMNATLRRLFGKSQKWNSSEMWWFRGCSPTATYKERERIPCEEPGALCHQASCEATISKVLMLLWWSVAFHRRKTALYSSRSGGSTSRLLSEELGFILRQHALTG